MINKLLAYNLTKEKNSSCIKEHLLCILHGHFSSETSFYLSIKYCTKPMKIGMKHKFDSKGLVIYNKKIEEKTHQAALISTHYKVFSKV